ncbi:G-protein coupled receptor 55-like [Chelonoidis abingdonii]|uniref:G-protein coupled receptors family 1 profile domain-containing protein n=1 Tax=Chelonoidis abingdonii TaxID=106734 RepID=A0A8C0H6E7_CHEAB|nr:G-protein coupled receptor 55-like [Chelonoidis abingdonii]
MDDNSFSKECSFDRIDTIMKSLQLVISIPTFIVGLILNLIALWVFYSWKKQTESSIYMINLALADLLLLFSLPFKMYYSRKEQQRLLCKFIEALYFVNMYGSIFIIVCISLDRYIAIRHPLKARAFRSPKQAIVVCCCIWVIVWLSSIPIYDFHNNDKVKCFHNMSEQAWDIPIILSVEIFGFVIPLTLMVYCSVQIIQTLWRRKNQGQRWAEQAASIWIILANLMVFVVSFTPFHLGIFLQFLVRQHIIVNCTVKQSISLFIQVAMCLANVNCCLDAICYYFATEEFRKKSISATPTSALIELLKL